MRSAAAIIGPGRIANSPTGMPGIIVHAVDFLDAEALHQAVLDHRAAAAAALLGRLEDHDRGAGEIARLGEIFRGAEQHRGVAVMAAGVHLAGRRSDLYGRSVASSIGSASMSARSPIDLAAPALAAADHADHAGPADAGHHLVAAEGLELLGHARGGAVHVEQQLRMGMDIAPPCGDFGVQVGDTVDDRHGNSPSSANGASVRSFPARIA